VSIATAIVLACPGRSVPGVAIGALIPKDRIKDSLIIPSRGHP
jgi:hypothetical protein